jgi:hypothetical protein
MKNVDATPAVARDIPKPNTVEREPHVVAGYTTAEKGLPRKCDGAL